MTKVKPNNGTETKLEEHEYTTSSFLFFLEKDQAYKTKKIINISCLIMVPIKMRLLISLVFKSIWISL